jgi:serine/threonine protein kinase
MSTVVLHRHLRELAEDTENLTDLTNQLLKSGVFEKRKDYTAPAPRVLPKAKFPYILKEKLGKGSYGTVYKANHVTKRGEFAVKKIKLDSKINENELSTEISALRILSNRCPKYVVGYIETLRDQNFIYIVTDYLSGLTLDKFVIENVENISKEALIKISQNLIRGLICIHNQNIAHRDIKPDNIIIDPETFQIKFIDFGLACLQKKICGADIPSPPPYRGSPEYFDIEDFTLPQEKAIDAWRLGITMYYTLLSPLSLTKQLPMLIQCEGPHDTEKVGVIFEANILNKIPSIGNAIKILIACNATNRSLNKALKLIEERNDVRKRLEIALKEQQSKLEACHKMLFRIKEDLKKCITKGNEIKSEIEKYSKENKLKQSQLLECKSTVESIVKEIQKETKELNYVKGRSEEFKEKYYEACNETSKNLKNCVRLRSDLNEKLSHLPSSELIQKMAMELKTPEINRVLQEKLQSESRGIQIKGILEYINVTLTREFNNS